MNFSWFFLGLGLTMLVALCWRTARRYFFANAVLAWAIASALFLRLIGKSGRAPAQLRKAFERLGPTYVKLGQLIASSEGMFPDAYCIEFRRCLDRVAPFDARDVDAILRAELQRDPADVFASFNYLPIASASIAQVHEASLQDGTKVVVKVQRPRLPEIVSADLRVLHILARLFERLPLGDLANPVGVVQDFEANLKDELDFRREAVNLDEFNAIMAQHGLTNAAAPKPYHELSSARVLVMERFYGVRIDDQEALSSVAPDDVEERLLLGMRAWFRCMLVHGFFHGDVHAGNLMALDDGRLGFLDFGIVGRFDLTQRNQVSEYLLAIATRNFPALARVMVTMGGTKGIDESGLGRDLEQACAPLLDPSRPVKYADFLPVVTRITIRHRMRLPREFVLILKQMVYFDRYAKLLAPKLNILADPRIISGLMQDFALLRQASANAA
jgi:predicted unusual protein kinase regulating ubiquinone biosynthesis (AarF/ABC1/UbiB family)